MPSRLIDRSTDPQLLEFLRKPLEDLFKRDVQSEVDTEKAQQYANARRNDLYYAGKQYLWPMFDATGRITDWTSSGRNLRGFPAQTRTYDYNLNYYRGDGDKAIAILAQKPPTVKGMPNRPDDDAATRRSRIADLFANVMRSHWRMDELMRGMALSLWKNGTTFLYTPWVANGAKYGTTEEPIISLQPNFDAETGEPFMVPIQDGMRSYANGTVECFLATIFEVTTPFYIKGIWESPWLWYEFDMHRGALMATHPELRELLRNDGGTSSASS